MKAYIDLQEWIEQQYYAARRAANQAILEAFKHYSWAWDCRYQQPDKALQHYQEAQRLAEVGGNAELALFFQSWCIETYRSYLYNYQAALEVALRVIVELRKYPTAPITGSVYTHAINVQLCIDPLGYAHRLQEMLTYVEQNLALSPAYHALLLYSRMQFAFAQDQIAVGIQYAERCLEVSLEASTPDKPIYGAAGAAVTLAYIYDGLHDPQQAYAYAQPGVRLARLSGNTEKLISACYWQALSAYALDNPTEGERCFQAGEVHRATIEIQTRPFYYTLARLYLRRGTPQLIAPLVESVLHSCQRSGEIYGECIVRLRYCCLLGQMGADVTVALAEARQAAQRLHDPQHFLNKLAEVARGNYALKML
jgi:tetratricopeptide (TPR) repeat protein